MATAFLASPFGRTPDEQDRWELHWLKVESACREAHVHCIRSDKKHGPTRLVVSDIQQDIKQVDFVIADVSESNVNVAFEVGFAMGLGKPLLLISRKGEDVPFDLQGYHRHDYLSPREIPSLLADAIQQTLSECEGEVETTDSDQSETPEPVTGPLEMEQSRLTARIEQAKTASERGSALAERAQWYFRLRRHEEALADVIPLESEQLLDSTTAALLLELKNRIRDFEGSLSSYESLEDSELATAQLHANAAYAYNALQQYDTAVATAKRALRLDPHHSSARKALAYANSRLHIGNAYSPRVEDVPEEEQEFVNWARNLIANQWYERAVAACKLRLEESEGSIEIQFELGRAYRFLKQFPDAISTFRKITEQEPDNGSAWYNLGASLHEAGDIAGATTALRRALQETKGDAKILSQVGFRLSRCRDNLSAVEAYSRSLEIEPRDPQTIRNRAFAFNLMRQNADALRDYETALEIEPHDTRLLGEKSKTLMYLRRNAEAIEVAKAAIRLDPQNAPALEVLGKLGDR